MGGAAADARAGVETREPWRLGSRVARLRASRSYGIVLALVVASFLFAAAAPNTDWALSVLVLGQSVTLVIALWTSGIARLDSKGSVVLLGLAVAAAVVNLVWNSGTLDGVLGLFAGLLTIGTAAVIALGVVDQREVNRQSIRGAIAIYVLFGMLFTFIYGAAAALGSGQFFAQGTDGTRALRLYFSFVTLATVGYGDYTAQGNFGHALAVIEALTGQLYLVTVVALLVSRLGRGRASDD